MSVFVFQLHLKEAAPIQVNYSISNTQPLTAVFFSPHIIPDAPCSPLTVHCSPLTVLCPVLFCAFFYFPVDLFT